MGIRGARTAKLAVLWGCGVALVAAAPPPPDRVLLEVTEHGVRFDYGDRQEVEEHLARIVLFLEEELDLEFSAHVTAKLRVFEDYTDYAAYARKVGAPVLTGGFYAHETGEAVFWRGGDDARLAHVLQHEVCHRLVDEADPTPVAPWLGEGLAEVFGHSALRMRMFTTPARADVHRQVHAAMADGRLDDLVGLLMTDHVAWGATPQEQFELRYNQAWSLARFLVSTPHGRATLGAAIRVGGSTMGGVVAIEATYPGGVDALDKEWAAWRAAAPVDLTFPMPASLETDRNGWVYDEHGVIHAAEPPASTWVRLPDGTLVLKEPP